VNENLVPQCAQKPSGSPGRPSLLRPTGRSQTAQNRLLSGTWGSAMIALAGSRAGTGGISIRPAPRLPRVDRVVDPRVRRDPLAELRLPDAAPLPLRTALPLTLMDPLTGPVPPDPAAPPADPAATTPAAPAPSGAAMPQTLQ
jgi:hypothetical protein